MTGNGVRLVFSSGKTLWHAVIGSMLPVHMHRAVIGSMLPVHMKDLVACSNWLYATGTHAALQTVVGSMLPVHMQ